MSVLDKFLNVMKLNDDEYDDGDYLDEASDDLEDDIKPRRRIPVREPDEDDLLDDDDYSVRDSAKPSASSVKPKPQPARSKTGSKVSSIRSTRRKGDNNGMEVCVIRPHSMEDASEITETLLAGCTVILNVEGLELEIAQRVVDFASGSCYAIDGNLQPISNYIFVLTPSMVDISGDFQEILSGAFDVPFERKF